MNSIERGAMAPERFREAMSRVAASVHIVATDGPAGRAGYTATAFTPVSDSPATVLVAINRNGRSGAVIRANGCFSVSVLGPGHDGLADVFAGRGAIEGADRFAVAQWATLTTGSPILEGCVAAFDCVVTEIVLIETHEIVLGRVVDLVAEGAGALLYHQRSYKTL